MIASPPLSDGRSPRPHHFSTTRLTRVRAHTETEIRKSFLNCSKGAAQRLAVPQHLEQLDWDGQIVLG